eukprot:sb/3463363/
MWLYTHNLLLEKVPSSNFVPSKYHSHPGCQVISYDYSSHAPRSVPFPNMRTGDIKRISLAGDSVHKRADLPGCLGERILLAKSGSNTDDFLYRGKLTVPVNRGSGKSGLVRHSIPSIYLCMDKRCFTKFIIVFDRTLKRGQHRPEYKYEIPKLTEISWLEREGERERERNQRGKRCQFDNKSGHLFSQLISVSFWHNIAINDGFFSLFVLSLSTIKIFMLLKSHRGLPFTYRSYLHWLPRRHYMLLNRSTRLNFLGPKKILRHLEIYDTDKQSDPDLVASMLSLNRGPPSTQRLPEMKDESGQNQNWTSLLNAIEISYMSSIAGDILCHTIARGNGTAAHTVMTCSFIKHVNGKFSGNVWRAMWLCDAQFSVTKTQGFVLYCFHGSLSYQLHRAGKFSIMVEHNAINLGQVGGISTRYYSTVITLYYSTPVRQDIGHRPYCGSRESSLLSCSDPKSSESGQNQNWTSLLDAIEISYMSIIHFSALGFFSTPFLRWTVTHLDYNSKVSYCPKIGVDKMSKLKLTWFLPEYKPVNSRFRPIGRNLEFPWEGKLTVFDPDIPGIPVKSVSDCTCHKNPSQRH